MHIEQTSELFGLNLLQDMGKGSQPIEGAYDPEQELWMAENGQVMAQLSVTFTNSVTGHPFGYGGGVDQKYDSDYDL